MGLRTQTNWLQSTHLAMRYLWRECGTFKRCFIRDDSSIFQYALAHLCSVTLTGIDICRPSAARKRE